MKYLYKTIPFILLGVFFFLSFRSMLNESVTVDEFTHLPAGYSYLKTGKFHLGNTNPPLGKVLAAIPLWIKNIEFTKTPSFEKGDFWTYGYDFMFGHKQNYKELFRDARIVILLIGLLGGYLVFLWAKELYGTNSAYLALFLYALCPNFLAHSHLVTMDVVGSTFLFAALYFLNTWTDNQSWPRTIIAGVFLGLAQLTKFTALILYPICIIFCIFLSLKNKSLNSKNWLKIALIVSISILILNSGYLFHGSFTSIREFQFTSRFMQTIASILPDSFQVPLPYDYVSGFDFQKSETEGKYPQFLMGTFSRDGWWYYYLEAFILKVPLIFLILLSILIVLQFSKKLPKFCDGEYLLLLTILLYFLMVSFYRHNIGFRFVLPVLPLLYVLVSRIFFVKLKNGVKVIVLSLIISTYVIESLSASPHFLSFFNILAGGPKNGYQYLIDSNIDWGQDLPSLKVYMVKNKTDTIDLAYFGRVDPSIYGINYRILTRETKGANVAVSINYYQGYPYFLLKDNKLYLAPHNYYTFLHNYPVRERIGYSILIIEIP
jgi:hypothetical protein